MLAALGRTSREDLRDREAFIVVALAWLLVSFFGALPFLLSGAIPDLAGAFFESTSGFTTTGASVIPDLENTRVITHSILMWRAATHLMGGMGIIVLSMVVLSRIVGGSTQLLRAEAATHGTIRMRPTLRQIAGTLWGIYLFFTALQVSLLSAAGMGTFDAICHSFATLATGGFSTKNVGLAYYNGLPWIGAITTVFMMVGGMSFILHYEWLSGKLGRIRQDPEFQLYAGILAGSSLIVVGILAASPEWYSTYREVLAHSIFQVVAVMTTTGFATTDFTLWPSTAQLVLLFLMMIGACSGSTAGGMKVVRFVLLVKMVRREIHKVLHPRAIIPITIGGRPISEGVQRNVVSFFFIYITIFCAVALCLSMLGMTVIEALSSSATSLGNVGPALGSFGPMSNFSGLHAAGKVLMAFAMWMGRLEIYPALLLMFPGSYKH